MNILSIQSWVAYGHVGNDAAVFPLRGRFDELHRQDLLQSPAATAAQVAAMIAAADFGQTVCRDVREP